MAEMQTTPQQQPLTADAAPAGLLDKIVEEGRLGRTDEARKSGKTLIARYVDEVLKGAITVSRDTEAAINTRIAQLDHLISLQLNEVLHHPELQRLESSWRGLKYLLDQSETGVMLKIKVLNVSKKELLRDLEQASEFDQSTLFKKVYEEEFGMFGGAPFAALVGDYYFDNSGQDVELLKRVSQVAAAAHAPFLAAASAEMFNLDRFTELSAPTDLATVFDNVDYAKWKAFRETEDARYVALTAPRILLREPYGDGGIPVESFGYQEHVDGTEHDKYLWGNAAWALAARVTNAFSRYGWCATIRGVESGGLVEDLPVHTFETDGGSKAMKCPTETPITDRREKELADLGFAPLVHCKDTPKAAFFSVQSTQKAKKYDSPAATANARLSAQLPYIFATSRFAHYLKAIMRDKIGSFTTREKLQADLTRWLMQYVANAEAPASVKAARPLSEARVEVVDIPGKPGAYRAVAWLKPHFQLDELDMSLRLVAEVPSGK